MILIYLIFSIIGMSFIEYAIHRWIMHNKATSGWLEFFESHTILHHQKYFRGTLIGCDDPAAKYISITLSPFFNILGLSPIWVVLASFSYQAAIVFIIVVGLHGAIWTTCHREMHFPKHGWLSRTRYYQWIRNYHHVHHVCPGKNFNAVIPMWDYLLGTLG